MKRLSYFVIAAVLSQSLGAHAQIMDLPDPGAGVDLTPDPVPAAPAPLKPAPVPTKPVEEKPAPVEQKPATPAYAKYESSENVRSITRKTGGLVYRLLLKPATSVRKVTITATKARLLTHETYLITESGQKVKVESFSTSQLIETGAVAVSETIDYRGPISAIDIRAESMGGEADIKVSVFSDDSRAKLEWQKPKTPKTPEILPSQPNRPRPSDPKNTHSSSDGFYVGEKVVESFERIEIRKIIAIKDDGNRTLFQLDDGIWYNVRHLSKLVTNKDGFYVGEKIVESFERIEFRKIIAISDNGEKALFQLDDGIWYNVRHLSKLVTNKEGYYVGEKIVESFEQREVRKIIAIAVSDDKVLFLLDDGAWYNGRHLSKLVTNKDGFYVGEKVVKSFERREIRKIIAIAVSDDKVLFQLDDGIWYHPSYIGKLK